ncbi:MAG: DUF2279 domain-containing protein [Ferruginibacter sp.]
MSQTSGQSQTALASHSCTLKLLLSFYLLLIFTGPLAAQDSTSSIGPDTSRIVPLIDTLKQKQINDTHFRFDIPLTRKQVRSRVRLVTAVNVTGYAAILTSLSTAWYSSYKQSSFHTFNDNKEWLQIDKVGHMYGGYIESRVSMELWRWTGIERKKRIWFGGLSGVVYQTIIETLDGFSSGWGWSWGDIGANITGSTLLISQELAWDEQRIKLKFSFHKNNYDEPMLNTRADKIYGKSLAERFLKDYNTHTFWASANLKSFLPKTNLPPWLAVAVGYGAEGMFGARDNTGKDLTGVTTFDRRDIKRYRQFYLAPDIDLTKIKTKKKGVRFLLVALSAFKFPTPSLEFSNGKFKVNALHF